MDTPNKSFWQLEKAPEFDSLPGDIKVNTVIVGAGICGLLCAYFLHNKGVKDVALIDADGICAGATAYTTAKITSQHGLIYARLIQELGDERAAQYLVSNNNAIRRYREIVEREQIDCDLFFCSALAYATSDQDVQSIENEVLAAQKLGIAAAFDTIDALPFPVRGAVRFPDQARFHPLKFSFRICGILSNSGCKIYTRTKATGAEEGIVYTDRGNIRAEHIIVCSNYPFIDKHSQLLTRIYRERSYVLALKNAGFPQDFYLDCAGAGYSFRPQKDENNENMILLSACGHKTGNEDQKLHLNSLRIESKRYYPGSKTVYMWSAQDCMSHDKIPYIGRCSGAGENIYIAAGFNKWGMTSSMAAAEIISDLIVKGNSDYSDVFCLDRGALGLRAKSFIKESADISGNIPSNITMEDKSAPSVHENVGGVVELGGKRVGVCKDSGGQIYAVKPVCTHMGCAVKWNKDDNTWDCTCHSSRFGSKGNVISGPALKPLKRLVIRKD